MKLVIEKNEDGEFEVIERTEKFRAAFMTHDDAKLFIEAAHRKHSTKDWEGWRASAFKRIRDGEKIGDIAPEYGLTLNELRAHYAQACSSKGMLNGRA